MFDVYLNDRRDLLVVRKGLPIPAADVSGRWRKKKRAVSVSEEISRAVQKQGYYMRKNKTCAYRKSNPDIFVMQSAEDRAAKNTPCPLHGAR
jgi:hypothetical protein